LLKLNALVAAPRQFRLSQKSLHSLVLHHGK